MEGPLAAVCGIATLKTDGGEWMREGNSVARLVAHGWDGLIMTDDVMVSDDREKLLRMAREAGFEVDCASLEFWRRLARFDELVRADERDGLFAAIEMHTAKDHEPSAQAFNNGINIALHCVRARGKQEKV